MSNNVTTAVFIYSVELSPFLLLIVCELTFQGILLSPHYVNQRVLQRVHTETIKGPCPLLLKERKTTISLLTSHNTI